MIINHNISALNSNRHFASNSKGVEKTLERLSSGERINKGSDDPAGLAVSEKMRAQIKGLHQSSRNIQDASSLVQTAEGFLKESNDVLQRMRVLSVQAANGTYTNEDRSQISVELDELVKELNRIHEDSKFNTIRLFDGYSLGQNSFGGADKGINQIDLSRNHNFNFPDGSVGKNGLIIQSGANTDERMFVEMETFNSHSLGFTDKPNQTYKDLSGIENENQSWREKSFYDNVEQNLDSISYLESVISPPINNVSIDYLAPQAGNRLDVTTSEKATETLAVIDVALNKVNKQRADLGAFQNRLEMANRGVEMAAENLQSTESRIRDADMAKEYLKLTTHQILSQSSSAMTAQANQKSQMVFRILNG